MTMDFDKFYEWTSQHLALDLSSYKQRQLQRRITTVMENAGSTTLEDYKALITRDPSIREKFLDYITINVTDFYRNPELFDEFEEMVTKELAPKFGKLKIWSAACSIGSEPYTLAMISQKNNIALQNKILATDLDSKVLARGKAGLYKPFELKNMEDELIEKHFTETDKGYQINASLKNMVNFQKHDLLLDPFEDKFHVILCRNVIIYFNKEVKEELYRKFSASLETGGILFTGATETIYKPELYNLEKIGTFLYQKV